MIRFWRKSRALSAATTSGGELGFALASALRLAQEVDREVSAVAIEPEPVPLTKDAAGRLMVVGTRVPLDTLVAAFERGDSPEAIQESYPTVALGDIYAIFTYCVRHRADVNAYLAERAGQRAEIRSDVEIRFPPEGLRAKLLTRLDQ